MFCMRQLNKNQIEVIEENGHMGCGFIPKSLLVEILGKTDDGKKRAAAVGASRVFAIQVRIFGPSCLGIAKGMLVMKDGIDKVQIPGSMIKVCIWISNLQSTALSLSLCSYQPVDSQTSRLRRVQLNHCVIMLSCW